VATTVAERPVERDVRTDIQALRAVAVAAVVVYHLWPDALGGGYVGVDAFFVISGFLITRHLFKELDATGRVRFGAFYARRIRRLLPAAFLVLAASLAFVVLFVPRVVWADNLKQISAASAYVVNWLLAREQVNYLARNHTPSVVQHYWSLSVEEQFYIFWPALLVIACWLAAKLVRAASRRTAVVSALVLVGLASFLFSVYFTHTRPQEAFFVTPTRVWEFCLGGLVGLLVLPGTERIRCALGWVGIAIVIVSCFVITESAAFPGWIALVPTIGTGLALAGGNSGGPTSLAAAVNRGPIQWIGDHSYSIYLWHWPPIIAMPWVLHGSLGTGAKFSILAATLVLGWLTRRYVEDPVRVGAWWRGKLWRSYGIAVLGAVVLVAAGLYAYHNLNTSNADERTSLSALVNEAPPCFGASAMVDEGCTNRYARPSDQRIAFAAADIPSAQNRCQQHTYSTTTPLWCQYGDLKDPQLTVALVGNSYSIQYLPMIQQWAQEQHKRVKIIVSARDQCLGLNRTAVTGQSSGDLCLGWSRKVQDRLLATRGLSAVIFVSHEAANEYLTGQTDPSPAAVSEAQAHSVAALQTFKAAGVATMVIKHAPGTRPTSAPECVARSEADVDPCVRPKAAVTAIDALDAAVQNRPDVTRYVTVDKYFCDADLCHAAIGGILAYYDDHHISTTYVRTMARYLTPDLNALVAAAGQG
jgi:peptidoglycan/LPS O-acetylase OafA/YrhL